MRAPVCDCARVTRLRGCGMAHQQHVVLMDWALGGASGTEIPWPILQIEEVATIIQATSNAA